MNGIWLIARGNKGRNIGKGLEAYEIICIEYWLGSRAG